MEKLIKDIFTDTNDSEITVIKLQGNLDSTTSTVLVQRFTKMLTEKKMRFILDMDDVEFVASSGWNTIIGLSNNIRQIKGDIKVAGMSRDVKKIFNLLEYNKILEYYEEIDLAVKSFTDKEIVPAIIVNEDLDTVEEFANMKHMDISEKILKIKKIYPEAGLRDIKKLLKTPAYNNTNISGFKLTAILVKSFGKRS